MMSIVRFGVFVLALTVLAAPVLATELFVDQKHPEASDKNPGTESKPFMTIQAAVDAAKPGDKIWIKAGCYEDFVKITTSGTRVKPITLSAWKDDHVQIGYVPRLLPAEGEWTPVKGSKSFQVKLKHDVPEDFLVLLNDKPILTFHQDDPPKDEKVNWAAYRKSDRTLMFNAAGKNPATLGKFEYGRTLRPADRAHFALEVVDYWIIRKLEFSHTTDGLWMHASSHCLVEDCFFTRCYSSAIFMPGSDKTIIRRCNFYRCGSGVSGGGIANIIEDNLLVECSMQPEDDIGEAIFPGFKNSEGGSPFVFKGNMLALQFLHNTISDNATSGWWADCPNIQSCRLVGNAFWDNYGGGIYNEDKVNDTITQGNCFYRNGAGSRVSTRWNVIDNLFFEGGVNWNEIDENPLRDGYMLLRNNAFIHPPQGYLSDYAFDWAQTAYPEAFRGCMVDRNRIWAAPGNVLINDAGEGKKYKSLEEIRKEFGWELHGQVLPYDQKKDTVESVAKAMGGSVVTYRVPWGKHSSEARPMLANAHAWTRWPGAPISANPATLPNYFWRVADGDYDCDAMNYGWGRELFHSCWQPESIDSPDGQPAGEKLGCRWYCDLEGKFPAGIEDKTVRCKGQLHIWGWRVGLSEGVAWLVMEGLHPDQMLPQGVGYWSPFLGAAPGARITVSLKIRGKNLASDDKGSPAVWLQFTNATGQHRQRVFLVGKDDEGKVHQPELINGSYDWKTVTETITAPESAVRMALFMGMRPCKGQVNFDDINISTASEADNVGNDILPPRLPLQKIKEAVLIDISKQANRRLSDEADNDGKGGWTDQGSGTDMRGLKTGERRLGGVMFRILPDDANAVIVLKSANRLKGDLPDKVTIPVGKKLDTLFFLHSAAWCPTGSEETFHYVIHYADGKDITLQVTGNNLVDWIKDPVARFPLEEETFTTVVETVKNAQFRQGSLYRMEWSASLDRRGLEIKSIDFVSGGKAVPILLAITGVVEW